MSHDIRTPINGIRGMVEIGDHYPEDTARQTECRHMKLCRHDFPFRFRPAALTKTGVHSQREDARSGSEQACP